MKKLRNINMTSRMPATVLCLALSSLFPSISTNAQTSAACSGAAAAALQAPFHIDYSCTSLGSVPGLPTSYGGLTLKHDDPNTLLIGGAANTAAGRIYQIGVVRNANMHITGFTGTATVYPSTGSTVGQSNDGGVTVGPGNVLFVTRYSANQLEQTKPGSTTPDKVLSLLTFGVGSSVGSIGFVPAGFPGAGDMKIVSYNTGIWYNATYAPDAAGTFDITSVAAGPNVGNGPEGIAFVPPSSPAFPANSVLIALYGAGKVITAPLDASGNPVMTSAQNFISGLTGAEGAFIDPLTGDFLFSTFGGSSQVIRVSGFIAPTAASVSISGRVATASGNGIGGASVTVTDSDGIQRTAITSPFGYYQIDGISAGQTCIINVSAKRYQFVPSVINVDDNLADVDFVPVGEPTLR